MSIVAPPKVLRGKTRFEGMDDWRGSSMSLDFQNEWIVAWLDEQPLAMSPDLICVLDSVSGEAIGTETIRYGQRVTVIALPPPTIFCRRGACILSGRVRSVMTLTFAACLPDRPRSGTRRLHS